MDDTRPSPEDFLKVVKQEEKLATKGLLKIFIGMAAGVGKTYAMLEEAQKLKREGVNVVVGIVNTHGRQETADLLKGLKIIPEKSVVYKDKEFKELDVEAIIKLHPEVVLVDELAHHNTPGSNHAKRWQDVMDILDEGINVYTTLNVQHIESLNDIVRGITEISVRETVPDLIIEKASSIQLVDITPDQLLERLKEGKVYLGDQSKIAVLNFFKKDKLTALREIVLRYAADKIDLDLRRMMPTKEGVIEWKPREKLLVAIDHNLDSQKLIRLGRRLAVNLDASWIVLHVNDGRHLSDKDLDQLGKNLALGRDLGGEVITMNDPSIGEGVKRVAAQHGVTQIVLGRAPASRLLTFFQGQTLLDWLVTECKDIDVHVIRQEKYNVSFRKKMSEFTLHKRVSDYLVVFLGVCLISFLCWLYIHSLGYKVIGFIFLAGILSFSLFFKKGPILFSSILFALIWDFFFIPPRGEYANEDIALNVLFFMTGITIGIFVDRAREQKEMLEKSEKTTAALYDIARTLASNLSIRETLIALRERLSKYLEGSYEFIIKEIDGGIRFDKSLKLLSDDKEKSAAIWSFESGKEAGWSTETLPSAQNLYLPLKGVHEGMGLLIYRPNTNEIISLENKNFLYNVCQQVANYLEGAYTLERAKQQEYLRNVEKIYNTILTRFSLAFDLSVLTSKSALKKLKAKLVVDYPELDEIESAFEIFIKVMNNINAMAQLSETMVPLKKTRHHIRELIEECSEDAKEISKGQEIETEVEEDLPMLFFDYHLMQILLQNLILNAMEHSPPESTVTIEAKRVGEILLLMVSDEGTGIPSDQLEMIFEKFYRAPDERSPGLGLGLAIAKTIAELHQGTLRAENLPEKGARFILTLPLQESA